MVTLSETLESDVSAIQNLLHHMSNPYSKYYPQDWPSNPFHQGEVELQRQANVQHLVMKYAPKVVRPYMPDQHREFYTAQPFMVAAARDAKGHMWSTLLMSPSGDDNWISSPDAQMLVFQGLPVPGDALYGALGKETDLGLLGIEFATKRRNRVNGRVVSTSPSSFVFHTDQSFGNCPQYIQPRRWWTTSTVDTTKNSTQSSTKSRSLKLTKKQMNRISNAETIFTATGYRGEGHDVRFGNDASHRGGPKGFVMVQDERTLILPEFAGNNHFNTLGNLQMDNRMGITIPFFEEGGMLQLSGWATVDMDSKRAAQTYPGALRLTTFHIQQVNEVAPNSLPVRWSSVAEAELRQLRIASIVQESNDVKSFHLSPLPQDVQSLWNYKPGQHLPIQLRTRSGEILRTYSLSGQAGTNEYRISVKRQSFGKASTFLHDNVKVGDIIDVSRPAGDFVLDEESNRTIVLISSGIGMTPLLPMLHSFAEGQTKSYMVVWIHGARNGNYHPFQKEMERLHQYNIKGKMTTHVRYSQPLSTDKGKFDSQGRIDLDLVEKLVPDLQNADFYICGSGSFMADIESLLELAGVDPHRIHAETF